MENGQKIGLKKKRGHVMEQINDALRALGYSQEEIDSSECLLKLPSNAMLRKDYIEKVCKLKSQHENIFNEKTFYANRLSKIEMEILNFRCSKDRYTELADETNKLTNYIAQCIQRLVTLNQEVYYLYNTIYVIDNTNDFFQRRDDLMHRRLKLLFEGLGAK